MSENHVDVAVAYYTAMGEKNITGVEKCLHPDVQFFAPLAKAAGKEAVLEAARGFISFFKTLTVRAKCGSGEQAMVVYDLDCPAPVGSFSSAALMTFKEGLIAKIELFYDARPFNK
jgi:ketosteroid isomerase-like protein